MQLTHKKQDCQQGAHAGKKEGIQMKGAQHHGIIEPPRKLRNNILYFFGVIIVIIHCANAPQLTEDLQQARQNYAISTLNLEPILLTPTGNSELLVSWNHIPTATSYTLYWSITPGVTTTSNKITPATAPEAHGPLAANQPYYYRVSYSKNGVESELSPEASAIAYTIPAAPSALSVTKASQTSLLISWPAATNALKYEVFQSTEPATPGQSLGFTSSTSINAGGLTSGNTYYYHVVAYAGPFYSPLSPQASSIAGAICGDNLTELAETCDSGGVDTFDCNGGSCQLSMCGDGYLNSADGEGCDDGNTVNGDGCSSTCQPG